MPKIDISYEALDALVVAGLKDMLELVTEGYETAWHEEDREGYKQDIEAVQKVLKIYEA